MFAAAFQVADYTDYYSLYQKCVEFQLAAYNKCICFVNLY
jgi:hypothetical protein